MASGRSATSSHRALMPRRLKADGERAGDGDAHVGFGELPLEPLPDAEDHGDAAIALGVEWLQCQPILERGQQRLEDRRDGVAF